MRGRQYDYKWMNLRREFISAKRALRDNIRELYIQGHYTSDIAKKVNTSEAMVVNILEDAGLIPVKR